MRNIGHDEDDNNFLCCCEYFNINNERSHLLGCCCDCEDVDDYFERSITRQPMPSDIYHNMYRTIQDRCRIPWQGGARHIPLDVVLPAICLPILALIASVNCWCTLAVFLALPFIVCYFMKVFESCNPNTKFFFSWTVTSCVLLMLVFEFLVVPQLEILPEENYFFIAFVLLAIFFLYSAKNLAINSMGEYCENQEPSCTSSEKYCRTCRMKQPLKSTHCYICGYCVQMAEYHSVWLNCCVAKRNLKKYLTGLIFSVLALFYGSYLTLTTVCHPFLIMDTVLIPDDCSDVFFDTYMALCFVSGSYSLLVAAVLLFVLFRHLWLSILGLTYLEWLQLSSTDRRCCGLRPRPTTMSNLRGYISV